MGPARRRDDGERAGSVPQTPPGDRTQHGAREAAPSTVADDQRLRPDGRLGQHRTGIARDRAHRDRGRGGVGVLREVSGDDLVHLGPSGRLGRRGDRFALGDDREAVHDREPLGGDEGRDDLEPRAPSTGLVQSVSQGRPGPRRAVDPDDHPRLPRPARACSTAHHAPPRSVCGPRCARRWATGRDPRPRLDGPRALSIRRRLPQARSWSERRSSWSPGLPRAARP